MKKIYERNLKAIKKRFPEIYEKLADVDNEAVQNTESSTTSSMIYIDNSMEDEKIIAVNKDNRLWYLNSRYSANEAARTWADGFQDLNYRSNIIVCGMANMMYVKALLKNLGKDNIVILYEPSEELFKQVLTEIDIHEELEDFRLFYFVEHVNMDTFRSYIKALLEYESIELSKITVSPNYSEVFQLEIEEFLKICSTEIAVLQIYKNTYILYAAEMNDNLIDNIPDSIYSSSVDNLKVAIEKADISEVPAIVVAAGPSLDKNIAELKNAKGKALIIAVDSAIRALLEKDIIPDLLVTVDPHKPMMLFEDERALEIPLVVSMHTRYDIMAKHTGKKFMSSDCTYIADIYGKFDKKISDLATGGSVANTAFSLAKLLGFKTIFLMGQDLAFTNNKKHAANCYKEKGVGEDPTEKYAEVEGINGEMLLTFGNFKYYRDWFEAEIKDNPDIKVINTTEGGAKIHGAPNWTLKDAIENFCKKEIDFTDMIAAAEDSFDAEEKREYSRFFCQMIEKSKELDKKFRSGIREYYKLKELLHTGKGASNECKKVLKKIEKINKLSDKEPFMELVSMYAKEDEYSIVRNIYKEDDSKTSEIVSSEIADKGIAILNVYIKANEKVLDRIQTVMERSSVCN